MLGLFHAPFLRWFRLNVPDFPTQGTAAVMLAQSRRTRPCGFHCASAAVMLAQSAASTGASQQQPAATHIRGVYFHSRGLQPPAESNCCEVNRMALYRMTIGDHWSTLLSVR